MPDAINPEDRWPTPPLPSHRPWIARLLRRPWPLIDVLVLKTRTCPLCSEAQDLLHRHAAQLGLRIRVQEIDQDQGALLAFGQSIPVVFLSGRLRFSGHVDLVLLRREVLGLRSRYRVAGRG